MADINDIIRLLDREVWIITSAHQDRRAGLIATFVCHASIVPELPRMLIGLAKQHRTWNVIEASRAFVLHLPDESHLDWVWRFGLSSGRSRDKFAGIPFTASATGCPLLPGMLAWMDCKVEASLDTGDRTVYLAEVVASKLEKPGKPLTMQRLLQLAPPERIQELRDGLKRDAAIDGAAIQQWRASLAP
jgi:flavin reductase (DIM6/NTAB) family NADH-FMN oxidoreductase RutF